MIIYVNISGIMCYYRTVRNYNTILSIQDNVNIINSLYDEGN